MYQNIDFQKVQGLCGWNSTLKKNSWLRITKTHQAIQSTWWVFKCNDDGDGFSNAKCFDDVQFSALTLNWYQPIVDSST